MHHPLRLRHPSAREKVRAVHRNLSDMGKLMETRVYLALPGIEEAHVGVPGDLTDEPSLPRALAGRAVNTGWRDRLHETNLSVKVHAGKDQSLDIREAEAVQAYRCR